MTWGFITMTSFLPDSGVTFKSTSSPFSTACHDLAIAPYRGKGTLVARMARMDFGSDSFSK